MLFAIDAGNTNITIGLFDGEKLEKTFRMTDESYISRVFFKENDNGDIAYIG